MSDIVNRPDQTPQPDDEQMRLAQRLREAREYLGLSQEYVAEQLNIPRPSMSAIETGKRRVSGLELKQLARLYRHSIEDFVGDSESVLRDVEQDETVKALFRTTKSLREEDRLQVLRFAQFLRHAGRAPTPSREQQDPEDRS